MSIFNDWGAENYFCGDTYPLISRGTKYKVLSKYGVFSRMVKLTMFDKIGLKNQ